MLKEVSVRTPGSLSSNHQRHDSARMAAWIILVWRDLGRYIFAPYSQIWVCLWNEPVKWAWTSMEHSKCTVTVSSKIVLYYFGIYISWLYDSIKFYDLLLGNWKDMDLEVFFWSWKQWPSWWMWFVWSKKEIFWAFFLVLEHCHCRSLDHVGQVHSIWILYLRESLSTIDYLWYSDH